MKREVETSISHKVYGLGHRLNEMGRWQMNTLMFFYTLAILVICIVTAVLSLAAYASSRRRIFVYGCGVFICYAIEMTEIFFFEYTLQNQSFPASDYYSITMPVLRAFVATASQAFIWLIAMDLLDKHSKSSLSFPSQRSC